MFGNNIIGKTVRQRYKILRKLGSTEGGMGETYLAADLDLPDERECVVKRLKPRIRRERGIIELFRREARVLQRLGTESDKIPQLYAYFEEGQHFYLVQELIPGHDLSQEIKPGHPWTEPQVRQLLAEVLEILAFVHQNNVIHRDIKPANIMRSQSGGLVLIDFGAVKEVASMEIGPDGEPVTTRISLAVIITPGYAPFEQQTCNAQYSTDLYALGMTAIEALTGVKPRKFKTGSNKEVIWQKRAQVSDELASFLNKMVRYDFRDRYQDGSEALAALQALPTVSEVSEPFEPVGYNQSGGKTQPQQNGPRPISPTIKLTPDLEEPKGQVPLDSPFYIERPPIESDCYETIVRPGAMIRIKAPREMGKSSLLMRILFHAEGQGYRTANISIGEADRDALHNIDRFLRWLCEELRDGLDLEARVDDHWRSALGSNKKCINYIKKYVLAKIPSPVVLALDEVDRVFDAAEIATDFFAILRALHERGKNEVLWQKLRLIIVHSKEVYISQENINQSPFNVGLPIQLPELDRTQVMDLVNRHGLDWSTEQLDQLMAMVGGHPYMIRLGLYEIARGRKTLSVLLEMAPTEAGDYSHILRRHLTYLEKHPQTKVEFQQVLSAKGPVEIQTEEAFNLASRGLVKFQGNAVIPACGLYRQYFGHRYRLGVDK
ncbi:MAG: AAA-like domain-containing protein [Hormoscilla sp.]